MQSTKMKKILASVLALMLAASMAACGGSKTTGTTDSNATTTASSDTTTQTSAAPASLTRVDKTVTLTWLAVESPDWPLTDNIETWKKITEATNVTIKWVPMAQADWESVYSVTMAAGKSNWPDLVTNKTQTLNEDGRAGAYISLDTLLKEKMPNVMNQLMKDPASFIQLADVQDNHIYSIARMGQSRNAMSWMIRKDWLDALGLKEPGTLDEFANALRTFKSKDPGGAGKNNIPMVIRGSIASIFPNIMTCYGMHSTIYTRDASTGECVVNATKPEFRQMCEWLNSLYKEGLLDPEFATADAARWESYINNSYAGATLDYTVRTDQFTKKLQNPTDEAKKAGVKPIANAQFIGLTPLAGPTGKRAIMTNSPMNFDNSVAITTACKNVDAACALLNYIYSDEGTKLTSWGIDGVSYNGVDANGNPKWVDDLGAVGQYSIQKTAKYGIQQPFMARVVTDAEIVLAYGPLSMAALEKNRPYWEPKHGYSKLDAADDAQLGTYWADLGTAITQGVAEFTTGTRKLDDAGWQKFQDDLKKLHVDEVSKLYTKMRNQGNDVAKERLAALGIKDIPQDLLDY